MRAARIDGLTDAERHLLAASVDVYREVIRKACMEDQGTPDGRPGTVGYEVQANLRALRGRLHGAV